MGPNTAAVTGQYWAILIKSVCSPFFLSSKRREGNDLDVLHLKDFFSPFIFFFLGGEMAAKIRLFKEASVIF